MSYQEITSINISSNSLFLNKNTQLDTTGKIDEKIAANKFNYVVDTLTTDESTATADLIFVETTVEQTKSYTLKIKSNDTYIVFDVPISSQVLIVDPALQDTYTLFSSNTSTTPHTQQWIKTDVFNDTLPITLSYNGGDTLTTANNITMNGTPTNNTHVITKGYLTTQLADYVLLSSDSPQTITGQINLSNSNNTITASTITAPLITTSGTGASITVSGTNSYIQTPILKLPINQ